MANMGTTTIQNRIIKKCILQRDILVARNLYLYEEWESDVIGIDFNDRVHEYEVKRSRNDFLADFKKKDKHWRTENGYGANYFYFACPMNLIKPTELPDYAGLIYVNERGAFEVKGAPLLHSNDMTYNLMRRMAIRIFNQKS